MSYLRFERASFAYLQGAPVVRDVDLALAPGELHCLVGRSGCGKTTLLKLAAGLLAPTGGQVRWQDGTAPRRDQVGFVFQAPTLLEWLTVIDNVLLPVSLHRRPTTDDLRAAQALLAQLGLSAYGQRHPGQLSGGQQSRVALARALVTEPPLLLLDEPFAALDAITREELQQDLVRLCRERSATLLFVTHDIAEAVFLGDRVSVMAHGRLVKTVDARHPRGGGDPGLPNCAPSAQPDAGALGPRLRGDDEVERDGATFGAICAELRAALGQREELPA